MSVPNGDQNNYTSGYPACDYSKLGTYNDGYSMNVPPQGSVKNSGFFIVPNWSPISYDSLQSKSGSCSGYQDITDAYGAGAESCVTTYRTSLCGNSRK
jgi:hypothetical protein